MNAIVLCLAAISFQDNVGQHAAAARDFSFGDISFTMSLRDFQRRHPTAKTESTSDLKVGLRHFRIANPSGSADMLDIKFIDDKPIEITVAYAKSRVDKVGGWEVMTNKMVERFGFPDGKVSIVKTEDGDEVARVTWTFENVSRKVTFLGTNKLGAVVICNTALENELTKRRSKTADLGF